MANVGKSVTRTADRHGEHPEGPLMSPNGAVGWQDIPLDGLNCYLRCVEAVLRGAGFTANEVIDELGGAVTDQLGNDGRPYFRLRHGSQRWHVAESGRHNWATVRACLRDGQPVLIWPDAFYWPGDRLAGRRHVHHHAVLAVRIDGGSLHYLDIDVGEASNFTGFVPITDEAIRACTRVVEVSVPGRIPSATSADVHEMISASIAPIGRFAQAADTLVGWWSTCQSRSEARRLAHAVDLWVLGDIQPQLYLLACLCRRFGFDLLADKGFAAAAQAKKISLFLFALHGYKPIAPYDLCIEDIVTLARRLRAVEHAAGEAVGIHDTPAIGSAEKWLFARLETLSAWHFGVGISDAGPRS